MAILGVIDIAKRQIVQIRLTPNPLRSDKNFWRYANRKIESRFQERQILAILGVIDIAKRQMVQISLTLNPLRSDKNFGDIPTER